ncbi:hypothetical protein [Halobaculum sp. EA56]|uniref:hypothetical protein n=1 Tax=Halobaculum sp. EA56 TaxID=3421648 RepID=UPI003EB6FA14
MRRATAVVLLWLVLGPPVAAAIWNLDERAGIALAAATPLAAVALLLRRLRVVVAGGLDGDATGNGDGGDEEGDGWSIVPEWQYEGRFAEAGGIARSEQERALREVEERAEEREVPTDRDGDRG